MATEEEVPLKTEEVELQAKPEEAKPEAKPEEAKPEENGEKPEEVFDPKSVFDKLKKEQNWTLGESPLESQGLSEEEAARRFEIFGLNEVKEDINPWYCRLARQFTSPFAVIIELAGLLALITALSGVTEEYKDFAIIVCLVVINAGIGFYEEMKAHMAMEALKNTVKQECTLFRAGVPKTTETKFLVPGDIVLVKGGMLVPADCIMIEGDRMDVDNSALTGESRLIKMTPGSSMLAGGTVKMGDGQCIVTATGANTMIGQASEKMAEGAPKGKFQSSLDLSLYIIVLLTVIDCIWIISIDAMIYGSKITLSLSIVVSLLISSVPVALPMVMTVTLAVGASNMSKTGAIITHLEALQEVSSMDVLCSDKTGTLTLAELNVFYEDIYSEEGFTQEDVLMWACVASNEADLTDAVDKGIMGRWDSTHDSRDKIHAYHKTRSVPFSAVVKRIVCYCEKDGVKYRVAKGILSKILKTGNDGGDVFECVELEKTRARVNIVSDDMTRRAFKTIAVGVENITDGTGMKFCGLIPMMDPPRPGTASVIASVRNSKIDVKMITGDHQDIAIETSKMIGLGAAIYAADRLGGPGGDDLIERADGFAQVLPVDKYNVVKSLQEVGGHTVGMTGDGVNDAAALARANIGIAVADATDAARRAADIILTEKGLGGIYHAVQESRCIFKRLNSYLIYRLGSTIFLVLQISLMFYIWAFNVSTFSIILIALFCDLAVLVVAYDWQHPGLTPTKPNLSHMMLFSCVFGFLLFFESIWWYIFCGNAWGFYAYSSLGVVTDDLGQPDINNVFNGLDEAKVKVLEQSHQNLDTTMFLVMGCSSLLAIFPARTKGSFLLSMPHPVLLVSVLFFLAVTTVLALIPDNSMVTALSDMGERTLEDVETGQQFKFGPVKAGDVVGYTWLYQIIWIFILDIAKMCTYLVVSPDSFRSHSNGGKWQCKCWGVDAAEKAQANEVEGASEDAHVKDTPAKLMKHTSIVNGKQGDAIAPAYDDNLRG